MRAKHTYNLAPFMCAHQTLIGFNSICAKVGQCLIHFSFILLLMLMVMLMLISIGHLSDVAQLMYAWCTHLYCCCILDDSDVDWWCILDDSDVDWWCILDNSDVDCWCILNDSDEIRCDCFFSCLCIV